MRCGAVGCGTVRCGVFLIYINDICNVSVIAKLILFADDTNLFFSHPSPAHLVYEINQELNKFSVWFRANKLSLNLDKICDFQTQTKTTTNGF